MFLRLGKLPKDSGDAASITFGHRRRFAMPIRQPLILVTQIQRCGGTLVTQLLDGHSQLHVHPSELHIGKPKHTWPRIDPNGSAVDLLSTLREKRPMEHARGGYHKLSLAEILNNPRHQDLMLPFIFVDTLQEDLFDRLIKRLPPRTQRDVLDHYITSYFNAWLDYAGLYRTPDRVKYWIAFLPRLFIEPANFEGFRVDYPDGRLIVPVRDPVSWYASARSHTREYADIEKAVGLWLTCNANTLASADRHPELFRFVRFEDLVENPKPTLERLLQSLGLQWEDCLMEPTFNGMPVASDSSFGARYGIDRSAADRTHQVDAFQADVIRGRTMDIYNRLLERAMSVPASQSPSDSGKATPARSLNCDGIYPP